MMCKSEIVWNIVCISIGVTLVLMVGFCIFGTAYQVEVERYTETCIITNMSCVDASLNAPAEYLMGFHCEKHSGTMRITAEDYGKYTIGETVKIEIVGRERPMYGLEYEYTLIH